MPVMFFKGLGENTEYTVQTQNSVMGITKNNTFFIHDANFLLRRSSLFLDFIKRTLNSKS